MISLIFVGCESSLLGPDSESNQNIQSAEEHIPDRIWDMTASHGIGGEGNVNKLISSKELNQEEKDVCFQYYLGLPISHTKAPFLLNGMTLRGDSSGVVLAQDQAAGTVYGHEDYPEDVFLSEGGEYLPDGAWTANADSSQYSYEIFAETTVSFSEICLATITNPNNTCYLSADNVWLPVTESGDVYALKIQTQEKGYCTVSVSINSNIGSEENNNG